VILGAIALAAFTLACGGSAMTARADIPDFSAFADHWHTHEFDLTLQSQGFGVAVYRTQLWCDVGQPPCDVMVGDEVLDAQVIAERDRAQQLVQPFLNEYATLDQIGRGIPVALSG
jgi:hypothetical protein